MNLIKNFKSGEDFRTSLQTRLLTLSKEKEIDIQELMKKVAFDRFLSRVFSEKETPWILKGGYALELQFEFSRATKDIDLVLRAERLNAVFELEINVIKKNLLKCIQTDLNDYFEYILVGQEKILDNTPYGGNRYSIECKIAKKRFINFYIDISINDVSRNPYYTTIEGTDWIGFAGINPSIMKVLAPEEIFAEKLHAYTLPRERENSRVRDLFDMYILISEGKIDGERLKECIKKVFIRRNTHALPENLPNPPESWKVKFKAMAQNHKLEKNLNEAFNTIKEFLNFLSQKN